MKRLSICSLVAGMILGAAMADDYPVGRSSRQIREWQRELVEINNLHRYVEKHHIKPRPPYIEPMPPEQWGPLDGRHKSKPVTK